MRQMWVEYLIVLWQETAANSPWENFPPTRDAKPSAGGPSHIPPPQGHYPSWVLLQAGLPHEHPEWVAGHRRPQYHAISANSVGTGIWQAGLMLTITWDSGKLAAQHLAAATKMIPCSTNRNTKQYGEFYTKTAFRKTRLDVLCYLLLNRSGILGWSRTELALPIAIMILRLWHAMTVWHFCRNVCWMLTLRCVNEAYGSIWVHADAIWMHTDSYGYTWMHTRT